MAALTLTVDGWSLWVTIWADNILQSTTGECLQWIASISKVSFDVCGVSVWHWLVHWVGVSVNKPTNSRQTRGGEGGGATATVAVQNSTLKAQNVH